MFYLTASYPIHRGYDDISRRLDRDLYTEADLHTKQNKVDGSYYNASAIKRSRAVFWRPPTAFREYNVSSIKFLYARRRRAHSYGIQLLPAFSHHAVLSSYIITSFISLLFFFPCITASIRVGRQKLQDQAVDWKQELRD